MKYAGTRNTFAGKVLIEQSGEYQLRVLALDAPNANFGQSPALTLVVK